MGATTIWERWDSLRPDGSINPGQMTSFNHYALGAVADWLHRTVGGLAPAEPGYRRLAIRPQPGGSLTHARARHRTPYGMAECAWRIADGRFEIEIVVAPNTTATVSLPGNDAQPIEVGSGTHRWSYAYGTPDTNPGLSLDSTLDALYAEPIAWNTVVFCLLGRAPDVAGHVGRALRENRGTTLRQVVASELRADEICDSLASALIGLRL
jgi:alpha-L-rhamnosidase